MSNKPNQTNNDTTLIIVGVVAGIMFFALIGFIIYYLKNKNKK
jgi:hypothetical protein